MSSTRVQHCYPLLFGFVILVAVAVVPFMLPFGWLATVAALVAATLALPSALQTRQARRSLTRRPYVFQATHGVRREQRRVMLPNGTERPALVVPLAQDHIWDLVLTRDGYVLVDQTGRVRHTLKTS